MKVTEFASLIAAHEGKKINLSIAQISEVLRVIDRLTHGLFYHVVRWL